MLGKKRNNQKSSNKPESFLLKLHDILSNGIYNKIIHWDIDGKRVIIRDVVNLCNLILPKFYKHHNYSSFVRQLNLYGFHKSKGVVKEGESYELESFKRCCTKEEISQIVKPNKKMKNLVEYIKSNQKDDSTDNDFLSTGSEDDVLKFLFEKNEENAQNSLLLKKEMEELKKENNNLSDEVKKLKSLLNSHANILEKILKKNIVSKVHKYNCTKNVKNLYDLFNKYLYYLKIYSPYVNIDNLIRKKYEKEETSVDNINTSDKKDVQDILNNNNINIQNNINNESILEEFSIFNNRNDFPVLDFSLVNNKSSDSLFNCSMYFN
jgi:hypothetical protein